MISVILCILISMITGFLLTYFLTAKYSIFERATYGLVIGLGLYTWIIYLFSLLWGLQFKSIYFPVFLFVVFCVAVLTTKWAYFKESVLGEMRDVKDDFSYNKILYFIHMAVFSFFTTIFWYLFYRTIIWKKDGIYVGLGNNYGDLPLHLAYITSFAWGDNIPPQNPSFAGEKLTYPFLSDFLSAIFLKIGLNFQDMLFIPGFVLTVALYGIIYYFTYRLTKRRLAAIISPFLFFFSGGFGFYYFFHDLVNTSDSLWHFLMHIPRDYTKIEPHNYHWITPLTCLNVPQRAFLFGFPITVLVFSLLYTGIEQKNSSLIKVGKWKEFLFAGILAGTLPLFHSHSFLAMLMVTIPLGLLFWDWRKWFFFFMPAFLLSLPQVLYLSGNVDGGSFFKPHFGWKAGKENVVWFWLKNTGLFWLMIIAGFSVIFAFYRKMSRMGFYTMPFFILFLLPNFLLFAPWDWDNIKILIYWFLGMMPVVAFVLVCLYENKRFKILSRSGFFLILFVLTAAGGIDVFKYAIAPIGGWKEFSTEEIELAKRISAETPADAVFLNAPIHNHLVFLSGRKSLMGFPGHAWSHGYRDAYKREHDIRKMLKGKVESGALIDTYKPHYVTIGPHEKRMGINKGFFDANYPCMITTKNYKVYDLSKKNTSPHQSPYSHDGQDLARKGYGLHVNYFDNVNWKGEAIYEKIDTDVEFHWSVEEEKEISGPFSALWQGYLDIDVPGKYTFTLSSDDGSWLYINDKLVVNNGGYHTVRSAAGTVTLEKGKHKIMMKYFDGGGGAIMNLTWIPPGGEEEKIPIERLKIKE